MKQIVALVVVAAMTIIPGTVSSAQQESTKEPFGFDLTGTWRFTEGDDPAWSDPGFDDSSWEEREVPDNWNETEQSDYDGFAWYRKTFEMPAEPKRETQLIAVMGFIDDADATYLNGEKIGQTGDFPPTFDSAWDEPREYFIPSKLINWGGQNTIAIRMYDGTGGGGFYSGPIGLYSKAKLRELAGLETEPASRTQANLIEGVLREQREALKREDLHAYMRTISENFFHDGDTKDRRRREIRKMFERYDLVRLMDAEPEIVVDVQGRLIADVLRKVVGITSDDERTNVYEPARQFLYFDTKGREIGNHSRFFRDSYPSKNFGGLVDFNVYLPPSYLENPTRRYPVVHMLHGINGSNIEWEVRDMDAIVDGLIADGSMMEMIIVFPDGSSGWYVNTSAGKYRSMIVRRLVPLVDKHYRTIPDREHRGISGVSMGGFGSYSIGLSHPELFSSLASHIGALDFPPLAGTPDEIAANSGKTPLAMVAAMTTEELMAHTYYFDACEEDEFAFDDAARAMDVELTLKLIDHEWQINPGRHNDDCWVPNLDDSFGLHTEQFQGAP